MSGIGAPAPGTTKVGRNHPCLCGSGRKYKQCCEGKAPRDGSLAGMVKDPRALPVLRERLQALAADARKYWKAGNWADANSLYREIARLDPMSAQAQHDLGVTCLKIGRLREATAILQRALELRPGYDSALNHLAHALEIGGRRHEASLAYRKLSRAADGAIQRHHYSARALAMEGKLEEAEKELRRLLVLAPEGAWAHALLGQLLSDRGLFEEAARHLSQASEAFPAAFQQFAVTKRVTETDRPLVDRMRVVAERSDLDVMTRITILFGLGKAFDDLGEYAEAMQHYQEANRLRAMSARLDRAALASVYDGIIAGFTAEAFARARQSLARPAHPGDDLPVFIVGMPRSGTTLVEQILSSHPAVAAGGELTFWWERLGGARRNFEAATLPEAAQDYRAELRAIGPQALRVTDKAPFNFEVLGLIRLALPDARVIHCRRHPVDTCLSIFFTDFRGRPDYAWDRGDLAFLYRQYERLMDHWRRVLPTDRFTEVEYETLIANCEAETRRLVAFCDLDWDDACLTPERNSRSVITASAWQARQPVYTTSVERWRRYEPWLGELGELLPGRKPANPSSDYETRSGPFRGDTWSPGIRHLSYS
jgi:tetratricopeptide (TPR) repeat protein